MIIFVAPYFAPEMARGSLGAARKIELILEQLARIDGEIIFVNTGGINKGARWGAHDRKIGSVSVREIEMPFFFNATITKIAAIMSVGRLVDQIIKDFGSARFVWLYNGYAFESMFGRIAKRRFNCPVVFEFEDWHFARSRGFSPKPLLDWVAWRMLKHNVDVSFSVNSALARRLGSSYGASYLLPGIVPLAISFDNGSALPFSASDDIVRVGYFGQLNVEKGADLVLALAERLPFGYELHVTGIGPLAKAFEDMSNRKTTALIFHGAVPVAELYRIVRGCDIILNPHEPLAEDSGGLFPFKVIEAVSSGRVLISTELPVSGFDVVLDGVNFVERDVESFLRAIVDAKSYYTSSRIKIEESAKEAFKRFGDGCVERILENAELI